MKNKKEVNLYFLKEKKQEIVVDKPSNGTLSGHAVGELFDKKIELMIKENFKNNSDLDVYRQYEYLNELFKKNSNNLTYEERRNLIPFETLRILFLDNRGKNIIKKWSENKMFEEKQNDTADILVVDKKNNFFYLLDVKSNTLSKNSQPPNIISALKLAKMCKAMLINNEFDKFSIIYIGIDWQEEKNKLVCKEIYIKNLFKISPEKLYINWAAALQIQFHVKTINQEYEKSQKQWCIDYLNHFVESAKKRIKYMENKWINPFEKVLKNYN